MSGDVQPRKRKDKRKKKEGGSLGNIHEPILSHKFKRADSDDKKLFEMPDQGEKIHIQNEHGVGGNICVKIIFFCLLGLLVGAVGLIYLQSQGSTDVDLPTVEESRFAEYFTGWLDDSTDDHEHEVLQNEDEDHDDHDDHEEMEEDHEEQDNLEEHEESGEQNPEQDILKRLFGFEQSQPIENEAEDTFNEKNTEEIDEVEEKVDVNEDNENEENNDEQKEDEDDDKNNNSESVKERGELDELEEDEPDELEEENELKRKKNPKLNLPKDDNYVDDDADNGEEDEYDLSQRRDDDDNNADNDEEDEYDLSQRDDDDDNDNDESGIEAVEEEENQDNDDIEDDNIIKQAQENDEGIDSEEEYEEKDEDHSESKMKMDGAISDEDLGYEEIDETDEELEGEIPIPETHKEIKSTETKSIPSEPVEKVLEEEEEGVETGGVAVKLSVGIALIIVAHLVLVRKWKALNNAPLDEEAAGEVEEHEKKKIKNLEAETEPVIFRRQTLIPENVFLNDELEEGNENEEDEDENEKMEDEDEEELSSENGYEEQLIPNKVSDFETLENGNGQTKYKGDEDVELEEEQDENEFEDENDKEEEDEENEFEDENDEEEEDEEEDYDYEEEDIYDKIKDEKELRLKQSHGKAEAPARKETIKEDVPPTPPPRANKPSRGPQESLDDFAEYFEGNDEEEKSQSNPKAEETDSVFAQVEESPPERKTGNEGEVAFKKELDFAEDQFENNPMAAIKTYEHILTKEPKMMRALIGRARALDHLAEREKSNVLLRRAIQAYKSLLLNEGHMLSNDMYLKLAERCIERMRFAGALTSAIDVHKALIVKFPNTPKQRNSLAVTYLMQNKISLARRLLNETLSLWPDNGFAMVHYGFILKTTDNNMEEGARMLLAGIQTREEGVIDGFFFYHLGDALNRLGREKEAMRLYEQAVDEGLFLSKYQRSLHNVNRLKGQPWWTKEETTYQEFFKKLEENWKQIRKEGLQLLNAKGMNLFKQEEENLKDTGDWRQLDLYFRGRKQANCDKAPITCSLVSSFKAASSCTRGQIKFSVMLPKTHAWAHCGPTNCRLRSHLGLVVPDKTFIRVAEETRSWQEGKFIIFDDSFEHEVWHNGTGLRLVLIVDVWHPELTAYERRTLSPI